MQTAHFGKWHLGRVDPTAHGFDESDGANSNESPSGRDFNQAEYRITAEKGIDFMRRQVAAGRPFLVQVDHYPIMINRNAREEMIAERRNMDAAFGLLLDALDELDIADNTYVIFSTDHGTQGRLNAPLSNGKGSVLEGGLRVPFPHYDLNNDGPATAMLLGDYKLVKNYEAAAPLFYNITVDPGETKDLAAAMPELLAEMDKKLVTYLKAIDAQMPRPNEATKDE